MKPDGYKVEQAINLEVGESLQFDDFKIHRYANEWVAIWDLPAAASNLGKEIDTPDMLRNFLNGNWNLGRTIGPQYPLQ